MSTTRRTNNPKNMRQERFASSPEFARGLMANLVAKRSRLLDDPADRDLIWFLQQQSHQPGALKKVAADLVQQFSNRLASPAMQKLGCKPGQIYTASQVELVRREVAGDYPLKGENERDELDPAALLDDGSQIDATAPDHPEDYPAFVFWNNCHQAAAQYLEKHLARLCLDPEQPLTDGAPWYFPTLVSTLREYMAQCAEAAQPAAVTSIGRKVCEALDYANDTGRFVLIDGNARMGKTYSAQAWCAQRPGRVRYVQVPSTNDDYTFFRAIASVLGVSINLNSKAQELRSRIEETLQAGQLMLVLDEAHYLWPQRHYRNTTPGRINWLMTALINQGVPVALITTPQFMRSQKEMESKTCWTGEQFTGRIKHYEKLPDVLSDEDLAAVATALLPGGSANSIALLVHYAQLSAKYLAGIDAAVSRAQYIAQKEGREQIQLADIQRAIKESVMPSDSAFVAAMNASDARGRVRRVKTSASPLQPVCQPPENRIPAEPAEDAPAKDMPARRGSVPAAIVLDAPRRNEFTADPAGVFTSKT